MLLAQAPTLNGCPSFPANSVYNTPIDTLPINAYSNNYINTINNLGGVNHLHANFGSDPQNEFPYATVTGSQPKVPIGFDYADVSDPGPYPIPPNAPIQHLTDPNADHHVIVQDTTNCILYEVFHVESSTNGILGPNPDGSWWATQGTIWHLGSNALRPDGWTSADAAGMAILPTLVRYEEVQAGAINHALRITAGATNTTFTGHVWPARHDAGGCGDSTQCVPFGTRFRLKASFNISGYSPTMQILLTALKKYGAFLTDNGGYGGAWFISGVPNPNWNDTDLHNFVNILSNNLEAVDESSLMVDPNSGQANQPGSSPTPPPPPPPSPSPLPTGWINIVNKFSGKCLDDTNLSFAPANPMIQYDCWGGDNQKWLLTQVQGGYKITNKLSNLQLDVAGGPGATGNGPPIIQWPYWGGSNEIWNFNLSSNGSYTITPNSSGKCMDDSGISPYNGSAIIQWTCWGGDNQKWFLVPVQ
ncbi:MAG: RICIN domain-containing protein [Acidobacteriaceae bacterium]|nr:RICIN domain-containing protein [Acidobacteriaceae bacterium]